MRLLRSLLLVTLSAVVATAGWTVAAGASAPAKAAKVHCDPKTAVKEIEPLFDIEANSAVPFKKQIATIQFGNQKDVQTQVKAVNKSNPLKTVRANPASNITFPDKNSAIGTLVITLDPSKTQTINQGPQFYMCVGKDQNGTKKGAWRITLYSFCNLAALAPCTTKIINKGLNALTPALKAEITK